MRHYEGPPSPFTSSHPTLARTNSDATSRPSQRSAALKAAAFPYATPHSEISTILYGAGGDTEPDTDYGDDDDDDDYDDDGSWHGMDDDDDVAHGDDERDMPARLRDHGESIPIPSTSSVLIWDSGTGYSLSNASPFASDDDGDEDRTSDTKARYEEDRYPDDVDMDSDYAFGCDRYEERYGGYGEQRPRTSLKRYHRERDRGEDSGHDVLDTLLNVLQSD